jgi:hypothetical protein
MQYVSNRFNLFMAAVLRQGYTDRQKALLAAASYGLKKCPPPEAMPSIPWVRRTRTVQRMTHVCNGTGQSTVDFGRAG